jgi:hypothetical protein
MKITTSIFLAVGTVLMGIQEEKLEKLSYNLQGEM